MLKNMKKNTLKKENKNLEQRLWDTADQLRANSHLKASEYSQPVLGLIFLRFADYKFSRVDEELTQVEKTGVSVIRDRKRGPEYYQAKGVMYLPEKSRYSYLLNLPESENMGKAINEAMKEIEEYNPDLKGILPKTYTQISDDILVSVLKNFSEIPMDVEGDMFGRIYEYFLGKFAMSEGQKGGEFFTPTSLVKLIVEVIEPYKGKVYDPACGSGGMFVQSANFIKEHKRNGDSPEKNISIYGQEKTLETVHLCKMNLAVHGLSGDVKQGNTFYEDIHKCMGKFDFVMANPPFNVHGVDHEKIKDDPRFKQGIPSSDNGNYLWIEIFYNALNEKGRAGFVMANSASDARNSEMEIRKKIVEDNAADVMIAVGPNFFYTVTLPCSLWFFDKGKKKTDRKDNVLFIDARNIFHQIDRAHRDFTQEQINRIAGIVRSYRGEEGAEKYSDIKGLCRVATIKEIREQGYSLNPGRYVGVAEKEDDGVDFKERLAELNQELNSLNLEAHKLEKVIDKDVQNLLK
jgi:type I restriction enzyme M protein